MAQRESRRIRGGIVQRLQFRQEFLDRIIQRELAGIAQLQDGDGREALRHGSDAEDAVRLHLGTGGYIAQSAGADMRHLAVDHDAPGSARHVFAREEFVHQSVDFPETRGQLCRTVRVGELRGGRDEIGGRPLVLWRGEAD